MCDQMPGPIDVRSFMSQVPRFHKRSFQVDSPVLKPSTNCTRATLTSTPPKKSNTTSRSVYSTHASPPSNRRRRRRRRRTRAQTTAFDSSVVEHQKAMNHFLALAKHQRQTSKQQQQTQRPSKTLINLQAREHTIVRSLSASVQALTETNNERDPKKTSAKIVRHAAKRMSSPGQHHILLDRWTDVAENRSREATLSRMRKEHKDARSYKFLKLNQRKQFDVHLNGILDRKKKVERRQAREREERVKEDQLRVKHRRVPARIRSKDNGLLNLTLESKRIFGRF